jgi:LysM repeat protein
VSYRRSPARYLAPLALAAAFFAVLSVVGSGDDSGGGSTVQIRSTTTATTTTKASRKPKPRTYTVRTGDVLSAIAEKTGVPLQRLLDLNADLDPQALHAGQKLTLRR